MTHFCLLTFYVCSMIYFVKLQVWPSSQAAPLLTSYIVSIKIMEQT